MLPEPPDLTLLQQRYIEASVLGPLIRALQRELGMERANKVASRAIATIARERGRQLASRAGRNDLASFVRLAGSWRGEGDLTIEVLRSDSRHHDFNVTRCRFAEMYREMGLGDMGYILSCGRDSFVVEGFNPRIKLNRSQTIMEGAPFCDFRYTERDREA